MKQITNKEYEEWQKYKSDKAKGRILQPDTVRFICEANSFDPVKIGRYFLELLPRISPSGNLYGALGNPSHCVFFWKEDGENGFLSNWYNRSFTVDGITYHNTEQYFMAQKAAVFGDLETRDLILQADSPKECKALGRNVKPFDSAVWDAQRFQVMKDGNREKYLQNPDLMSKLLATGDALLAEASPYDDIWGIQLSAAEALISDPASWPGQNLQGKLLMELRAEFSSEN